MARCLDLDLERAAYLWMEKSLTWDFLGFLNESIKKRGHSHLSEACSYLSPLGGSTHLKGRILASKGGVGERRGEEQLGLAHLNLKFKV